MSDAAHSGFVQFTRSLYKTDEVVPLHVPTLGTVEKETVCRAIDSQFVSSVGAQVKEFEKSIADFTGSNSAVSTMNGTAALHACLHYVGVSANDLVITQALTFVATCNAITQLNAEPVFVDVSRDTLGMCGESLELFLDSECFMDDSGNCRHRETEKTVKAIVPMHTFGHPVKIDEIVKVAQRYGLPVIEDAAESLGSYYKGQHTGTFGNLGVVSFNGNKIITTGGGGMVLCKTEEDGLGLLHLTTTAKIPHAYEFFHDIPGFNYRMPNLNAALGVAQFSRLTVFLEKKRILAEEYKNYFDGSDYVFVSEPENAKSNYWLNAIHCPDFQEREVLLKYTNAKGIMTRPVWTLMHRLPAYEKALRTDLHNSEWAESTLVNLPSTPITLQ